MAGKWEFFLDSSVLVFLRPGGIPCDYLRLLLSWTTEKQIVSGSLPSSCFFLTLFMSYC